MRPVPAESVFEARHHLILRSDFWRAYFNPDRFRLNVISDMTARIPSRRSEAREIFVDNFCLRVGPATPGSNSSTRWIAQFCHLPQNLWYVAIDSDWVFDWFNQHGFNSLFQNFEEAIDLIVDKQGTDWEAYTQDQVAVIHSQALRIYGLMHARWICQPRGMASMKEKYDQGVFGKCPRFACNGTNLLPMGTTLIPRRHSAKLFCPQCCDIYRPPPECSLDGAHFGPAFPHMFLFEYVQLDKSAVFRPFEEQAFGFRVRKRLGTRPRIHDTNVYEQEMIEQD
jgi:casein kinase II subunit beta